MVASAVMVFKVTMVAINAIIPCVTLDGINDAILDVTIYMITLVVGLYHSMCS